MNRGSMSKQISTAPKSKSKKVKKMAFGGLPGRPGMGDMPMPMVSLPPKPGMPGRPGMGDMPMPMVSLPPKPAMAMAKGGKAKKMAKGGKIDGCCMKGHTKGTMR